MTDFEAFQAALRREEEEGSFGGREGGNGGLGGGSGYMGSLLNSMSLMLEEFYRHLNVVGVSAMTGKGVDGFFEAVKEKAEEFERDYRPELEKRQKERARSKEQRREKELGKLMKDMNVREGERKTKGGLKVARKAQLKEGSTLSDLEDDEMEDEAGAGMEESGEDEEEEDDDGEDGQGGLSDRYKKALAEEGGSKAGSANDEHSFTRYLRASQMNG